MNKFSSFCFVCCIFAAFIIITDDSFASTRRSSTQTSRASQSTRKPATRDTASSNPTSDFDCQCVLDYENLSRKRNLTTSERNEFADLEECECVKNYLRKRNGGRENSDENIMEDEMDQQVSGKRTRLQRKEMEREREASNRGRERQDVLDEDEQLRQRNVRSQQQDDWMHEEAQDNDILSFNTKSNSILDLKPETLNHISKSLFDGTKYMIAEADATLPLKVEDSNSPTTTPDLNSDDFSNFLNQGETDSSTSNKNVGNPNHEHKKYRINKKESKKLLKELDEYRKIYA